MFYDTYFLKEMSALPNEDQVRVSKAVRTLAEKGSTYPGLKTEKMYEQIPHTPGGAFQCRATDELRFTWTKSSGKIIVHFLYRKGDTRIRQSEK